jgi:hypothetical protein
MKTDRDWDPAPQEREWFRESSSGDLGYRVRREGIDKIRLDRPHEEIVRAFKVGEWVPEQERRPMTIAQVAEIAFLADRRLITFTVNPGLKKDWVDLSDEVKIDWMEKGPKKDPMRAALYKAIMDAMRPWFR